MAKNAYAKEVQMKRQLAEAIHTKLIRQETADLATMVLYQVFGFGPERQKRFNQALNKKLDECLELKKQDTADMEYTISKFEAVLKEACGPYYVPREERYSGLI